MLAGRRWVPADHAGRPSRLSAYSCQDTEVTKVSGSRLSGTYSSLPIASRKRYLSYPVARVSHHLFGVCGDRQDLMSIVRVLMRTLPQIIAVIHIVRCASKDFSFGFLIGGVVRIGTKTELVSCVGGGL